MVQNVYWVYQNVLLAGGYPAQLDHVERFDRLRWLLNHGVISFLDLTEPGEYKLPPYQCELMEISAQIGLSVDYARFPIRDMDIPTIEQMINILDRLDQWISLDRIIYLHCYGGKGRTGTVVGCHLVRHGWDQESALERIDQLRSGLPGARSRSPETLDQYNFVRGWKTGL